MKAYMNVSCGCFSYLLLMLLASYSPSQAARSRSNNNASYSPRVNKFSPSGSSSTASSRTSYHRSTTRTHTRTPTRTPTRGGASRSSTNTNAADMNSHSFPTINSSTFNSLLNDVKKIVSESIPKIIIATVSSNDDNNKKDTATDMKTKQQQQEQKQFNFSNTKIPEFIPLSIGSFLIAELLNYCGAFQDEMGLQESERAKNLYSTLVNKGTNIYQRIKDYMASQVEYIRNLPSHYKTMRAEGGLLHLNTIQTKWEVVPYKYQFAMGSILGIICSKAIDNFKSRDVVNISILSYMVIETVDILNSYIRQFQQQQGIQKQELNTWVDISSLIPILRFIFIGELEEEEDGENENNNIKNAQGLSLLSRDLKRIKKFVRDTLSHPQTIINNFVRGRWILHGLEEEGILSAGIVFGFLVRTFLKNR